MRDLPMFPLGTVLLPHMVLPLHVFEPRYRALVADVLAGGNEFGVTLITHGREVGGGDQRSATGTIAKVLRSEELDDGRWLLLTLGTTRFDVVRWLDDDPYPRALVQHRPERHDDGLVSDGWRLLEPRLRRTLAMQAETGDAGVPATVELSHDPRVACWQAAVVAPLGPLDAQQVLTTDDCALRLELLGDLVDGLSETFAFRLESP